MFCPVVDASWVDVVTFQCCRQRLCNTHGIHSACLLFIESKYANQSELLSLREFRRPIFTLPIFLGKVFPHNSKMEPKSKLTTRAIVYAWITMEILEVRWVVFMTLGGETFERVGRWMAGWIGTWA